MDFQFLLGQMTLFEVLWKCDLVTLSKICLRLRPCAYLSINLGINWIISRIPRGISKIIFVQGSMNPEQSWMAKLDRALFSMIQYCKITVWFRTDQISWQKFRCRRFRICENMLWTRDRLPWQPSSYLLQSLQSQKSSFVKWCLLMKLMLKMWQK